MTPRVVGVDLGIRRTGIAGPGPMGLELATRCHGYERHHELAAAVVRLAHGRADLVVVEDYATHAHPLALIRAAELGGIVRTALTHARVPWALVNPMTLKLYATGSGGSGKDAMAQATHERAPGWTYPASDNAIDALWLRDVGRWALDAADAVGPFDERARARFDELTRHASWVEPLAAARRRSPRDTPTTTPA